jgi:hypothetical protein
MSEQTQEESPLTIRELVANSKKRLRETEELNAKLKAECIKDTEALVQDIANGGTSQPFKEQMYRLHASSLQQSLSMYDTSLQHSRDMHQTLVDLLEKIEPSCGKCDECDAGIRCRERPAIELH